MSDKQCDCKYEELINNLDTALITCDFNKEMTLLYANNAFFTMIGYSRKEFNDKMGNSVSRLIHSDDLSNIKVNIMNQLAVGNKITHYVRVICKNNSEIWVMAQGKRMCKNNFQFEFSGSLTDITEKRIMQSRLENIKNYYEYIMELVGKAIFIIDIDKNVLFASSQACKFFGGDKKRCVEKLYREIEKQTGEIIDTIDTQVRAFEIHYKNNIYFVRIVPVNESKTRASKVIIMDDMTLTIALEKSLSQSKEDFKYSEKRCRVLTERSGSVLFDYIVSTKQFITSKGSTSKFVLPEILENGVESFIKAGLVHLESVKEYRNAYNKIDSGVPFVEVNILLYDSSGKDALYRLSLTNIFDAKGKPVRAIGMMADITDIGIVEQKELKALNTERRFIFEANITNNSIISYDINWMKESNVQTNKPFSDIIEYISLNWIHPDFSERYKNFLSVTDLDKALKNGITKLTLEYRRKKLGNDYQWVQMNINIMYDERRCEMKIRSYVQDIAKKPNKLKKIVEDKTFYDSLLASSLVVYAVNLTTNYVISGAEKWADVYGVHATDDYTEMLEKFCITVIHPKDAEFVHRLLTRNSILSSFYNGKDKFYCEYRRLGDKTGYIWVSCTMNVYEDSQSNEIKAFAYIQNIHEEKTKRLEEIYKSEHDSLTGLYNNQTAQLLIDKYISDESTRLNQNAFLVVDIDSFSEINKKFNHSFGDAVLSQTAAKIKSLFRDNDIIARVASDQIAVFMKNIPDINKIMFKARQINEVAHDEYLKGSKRHEISVNIGISLSPFHAKNYKELFECAKSALQISKAQGKNMFEIYNSEAVLVGNNHRNKEIMEITPTREFSKNISEYVFRILYESTDKEGCIDSVLNLIGMHYGMSRVYVFEDESDKSRTFHTFEWCKNLVSSRKKIMPFIEYSSMGNYYNRFSDDGILYLSQPCEELNFVRKVFKTPDAQNVLQFIVPNKAKPGGFVGFDQCEIPRALTHAEIMEMKSIASILGVYIIELRKSTYLIKQSTEIMSMLNSFNSYAYTVDSQTYRLIFVSDKMKNAVPQVKEGDICYKSLWDRENPCQHCPIVLYNKNMKMNGVDIYNDKMGLWLKTTAAQITDTRYLIDNIDISSYIQSRRKN